MGRPSPSTVPAISLPGTARQAQPRPMVTTPPLPSSTAFVTNTYDTLGRVQSQANGNNSPTNNTTWNFYFAGYRSEEDDAYGIRHVLYLNPRGQVLFDIHDLASLDRVTTSVYDGRD